MDALGRPLVSLAIALCAAFGGCAEAPRQSVLVLAASSTQDVLSETADAFEAETGVAVEINAAASNALAAQLLNGAPGDLFLAASPVWVERIEEANLAAEVRPLLGGTLVLIVPRGNPAAIEQPGDLLSEQVEHVALAAETVPAGIYAEQALTSAGLYSELVRSNRIARGHDVRVTLSYVERGEAEAGIVYETDARLSKQVEVIHRFDPASHDPIVYPLALTKHGAENPAARRFFEFLQSDAAAAIFEQHGFEPIARPPAETVQTVGVAGSGAKRMAPRVPGPALFRAVAMPQTRPPAVRQRLSDSLAAHGGDR